MPGNSPGRSNTPSSLSPLLLIHFLFSSPPLGARRGTYAVSQPTSRDARDAARKSRVHFEFNLPCGNRGECHYTARDVTRQSRCYVSVTGERGREKDKGSRGINVSPVPNEVNRIISCDIDCSTVASSMLCATGCVICETMIWTSVTATRKRIHYK